jgi:hypothetical protein
MAKKIIAFDLDGTLAPSKSPLPDRMSELLGKLLKRYQVCVISGGKYGQFEKQLLSNLKVDPIELERLHIMPTCGTRYMKYDVVKKSWEKVYAEDFSEAEKEKIVKVLTKVAKDLGYEEKKTYGEIIEDRGSQVSWSALGQDIVDHLGEEGVRLKEAWDPDNAKKNRMRDAAAELLPGIEVRVGGLSTIDVTRPGIDKAYGMRKLMEMLDVSMDEILFIGDRVQEGGNDYPVKAMGIECLEVPDWKITATLIESILYISE